MKRLILFKTTIPALLIPLVLACFGLAPMAQAVGPDTDGTIPGSNNGEGIGVLISRTTGVWNTGTGFEALSQLTAGNQNTATGLRALTNDINGGFNTATGVFSLFSNTSGFYNSATGGYSLANNISGTRNTANGYAALYRNTADNNTATGAAALYHNTTGGANTANGYDALATNTAGSFNTAVGAAALASNTGIGNTALGAGAGSAITFGNNVIAIGNVGANLVGACFIGNIRGVTTANNNAVNVMIDSAGQLGTISSSRRFKKEIKPMDKAREAILALKPVTFHYKSNATNIPQFGLIAEEVAEANPDLIVRDKNGEIYTVRYDAVNAMLLNEFLKEHRKVEQQAREMQEQQATIAQQRKDSQAKSDKLEATIAQQQKQMEAVTARLNEQAAQIQKVSAQLATASPSGGGLEATKAAPQTVLNK